MKPLVNLTMFRGYVNKILPTVYEDSLSYYEVLAKVMEKLNEVIELDNKQNEIINNLPLDVSSFAEELAEFKSDMTQQFNDYKDLMNASFDAFEEEVNTKIATDSSPTEGSTKLVTSGGVYAALQDITDSLIKDALPTQESTNYVTSGGVYTAIQNAVDTLNATLATKQNTLTFDTTPTENSANPVQSGGIKTYVDNKAGNVQANLNTYITNNDARSATIEGDITDLETGKQDNLNFDTVPTLNSQNPVTSDGIARAISGVTPEIDIDPTPISGSTNAVSSNGVYQAIETLNTDVTEALATKQDELTFDVLPTQNSMNPVTSGGVWQKFSEIDPYGTVDPEPTEGSTAAVSSGGTWSALQQLNSTLSSEIDGKQDTLIFDDVPTEDSENPVYSKGVFTALEDKQDNLTFDAVPTEDSENPVYSGGIFDELELKADKTETEEYAISDSVFGINPIITNSANGNVQNVVIYGESKSGKNLISGYAANTAVSDTGNIVINNGGVTTNRIAIEGGQSYVLSGTKAASMIVLHGYDNNNTYLSFIEIHNRVAIVPSDYFDGISEAIIQWNQRNEGSILPVNGQFEAGTEPTAYEPYTINSIGDGGTINITTANSDSTTSTSAAVTTGLPLCGIPVTSNETYTDEHGQKWLADSASIESVTKRVYKITLDGSEEGYNIDSNSISGTGGSKVWTYAIEYPAPVTANPRQLQDILISNYPHDIPVSVFEATTLYNACVFISSNGLMICGRIDNISTVTDVKTYLTSNPVTVVYELATPAETPLTTSELSALHNLNTYTSITNVTVTDSPSADVGYLLDTTNGQAVSTIQQELQRQISDTAPLSMIAPAFSTSNTYEVDDYVIYNRGLYKCTTAVETAGAWDATKWTASTVADMLNP